MKIFCPRRIIKWIHTSVYYTFFIDRIENKITLLFLATLVFPKTIVGVVFCICSNITKIFFIFGGILTRFIIFLPNIEWRREERSREDLSTLSRREDFQKLTMCAMLLVIRINLYKQTYMSFFCRNPYMIIMLAAIVSVSNARLAPCGNLILHKFF